MRAKILTPNKRLYEGEAETVTFPGEEGEFQVLENHASLFALLDGGEIIIEVVKGKGKRIAISEGIVEVLNNKATCLVKEVH